MSKKELLSFPCEFPVKIFGPKEDEFLQEILAIVSKHFPNFEHEKASVTESKNAKYISITTIVYADSKKQLDSLYMELTKHSKVTMAL